jgi:hypothetical protein
MNFQIKFSNISKKCLKFWKKYYSVFMFSESLKTLFPKHKFHENIPILWQHSKLFSRPYELWLLCLSQLSNTVKLENVFIFIKIELLVITY